MSVQEKAAPVVVGVDGTDRDQWPLRYAAEAAESTSKAVLLVHAVEVEAGWPPGLPRRPLSNRVADTLARGEKVLDEAETVVRSAAPDVAVERRLVSSSAAQAILDTAVPGSLIVLGRRRLGPVARVVDGSVTVRVAAHARGPVVVVGADTPGRSGRSGVVVGVDGSEQSQAVVRFAMQAAALLGTHVTAVTAWNHPVWTHPVYLEPPETIRGRARKRLLATVDEARGDFPDVPVRIKLTRGYAADALVADSRSAQMVVVGSRGRGAVEGLLLGSVGQTLLHRAESPVVVVPAEGARERRTAA